MRVKFLFCLLVLFLLVGIVEADTLILNPKVDGYAARGSDTATYLTIRNGAGEASEMNSTTSIQSAYLNTGTGVFSNIQRGIVGFNTSGLPDDCTVDAAVLSLYYYSKANALNASTKYGVTGGTLDTAYSIDDPDYDNFGGVRYSSDIAYASIGATWTNYTFNAAGIANVSKTGATILFLRDNWDIDASAPTLVNSKADYAWWRSVNYATTGQRPFITITYTPAAGGDTTPPPSISNLANTTTCNSINWTWTNPGGDHNGTMLWLNGTAQTNLTNTTTYYLMSSLSELLSVEFATKTFDITGNVNATFMNMTAITTQCGAAPVSSFTLAKPLYRIPGILQVNDTSTNTPTGWNWSWGDGTWTNGTTQNATHKYTTRGTKVVSLLCSNAVGNNTSASQNVRIVGYENSW